MPTAKIQLPDGRIARFEVPEGTTEQQVMDFAASEPWGGKQQSPPADYRAMARQIAQEEGVDPDLFSAQIGAESNFNPAAKSKAGAIGLAQLMPGTAKELGADPYNPESNLRGGARYLKQNLDRFNGNVPKALAAYNAGPGAVDRAGGVPNIPETQAYVKKVMAGSKQQGGPKATNRQQERIVVDPTDGMTPLQLGLAGMGKSFYDIGTGVGQIGRQILHESWSNAMGLPTQAEIDEGKKLDEPLLRTKSGMAGNIAGNIAMVAPTAAIPGANTYTGAAAVGGLLNALQPIATGDSRGAEAAKGAMFGILGQGLGNVVGRALKPVRATMPQAESALVTKAQQMGIPLNAAQITGSKPLRWIDSALDNLPFTAGRQASLKGNQRDIWQNAVLKEVGENADVASPAVLGNAYQRLGQQFEDISARNTVQLGDDFINSIAKIDEAKTPFSRGVDSVVNRALDLASKGEISGKEYQLVRSSLTKASKGAWQNNPELGQALKSLRNALDDAASGSVSAEDKAAWNLVRQQYATIKTVEKAVDPATGTISPKKLINEVARSNPKGMLYGKGDQTMPTLARVGKQFIADTLPDSGTAQRSWYMNLLQAPTAGLGGLLGYATGGAPLAMLGAAAGAGTPLAAQRALWSNGRYLTKGLLDPAVTNFILRNAAIGPSTLVPVSSLLE